MNFIEPKLQLAPHENPLRRRADLDGDAVFFEAHCFGQLRQFIGQSINEDGYGNSFFFQLRDEPERGTFVYSCNENAAQFYIASSWAAIEAVEEFKECVESNWWGRYLVLDSSLNLADSTNGCNTLFLNWNGLGMFHQDGGSFARFRWSEPCLEELWNLSASELLSRFTVRVQEPQSEPQFALWWASLSTDEHFDLIFPLARETYQEWQNICCLLPTAFVQWPAHLNAKLYARFEKNGDAKSNFFGTGRAFQQAVESVPLNRLSRWLYDYFAPQRNDELCARYPCARDWAQGSYPICEVRIDGPTQHERLEALLQLRDWLRDKATPDEIERLLRDE